MRARLIAAGLLLTALSGAALFFLRRRTATHPQLLPPPGQTSRGLIYKAERGARHFYLAGSIHMLTKEDYPLPPAYEAAFAEAAEVWFELNPDEATPAAVTAALAKSGQAGPGGLSSQISPQASAALEAWAKRAGASLAEFNACRGWRAATMLAAKASQQAGLRLDRGVDAHFKAAAIPASKPVRGLETLDSQLGAFAALSDDTQSRMILQAVTEYDTATDDLAGLLAAWRSGDLAAMESRIARSFAPCPEARTALLDARNAQWLPQLLQLGETPPVEMVIAGAGHLPGPRGLIALLRNAGWTVEAKN